MIRMDYTYLNMYCGHDVAQHSILAACISSGVYLTNFPNPVHLSYTYMCVFYLPSISTLFFQLFSKQYAPITTAVLSHAMLPHCEWANQVAV